MEQKGERDFGFRIAELKVSGVGCQVSELIDLNTET